MGNYIHGFIGGAVGYQVRLDTKVTDVTKLVFMTEGTLLRIAMGMGNNKNNNSNYSFNNNNNTNNNRKKKGESSLSKYSVIIIDEEHERTVDADLLMGYLKTVINEQSQLNTDHSQQNQNRQQLPLR